MAKPKQPESYLPLKPNWFHVLLSLPAGEQHGYGIMQEVLERTGGKVRLWRASLYGTIKRLFEEGLIEESAERPAPEIDQFNRREFLESYHKRSNVESTCSMIKAKFGASVRSKTPVAQMNEVLCKIVCHNLCVLVQSIYELGIAPTFWAESPLAQEGSLQA